MNYGLFNAIIYSVWSGYSSHITILGVAWVAGTLFIEVGKSAHSFSSYEDFGKRLLEKFPCIELLENILDTTIHSNCGKV